MINACGGSGEGEHAKEEGVFQDSRARTIKQDSRDMGKEIG
jgi:hypothetical protein